MKIVQNCKCWFLKYLNLFHFQIVREGRIIPDIMTSGTELSEAQIEEYRDAFKLFDADGDGTISVQVTQLKLNSKEFPIRYCQFDCKSG